MIFFLISRSSRFHSSEDKNESEYMRSVWKMKEDHLEELGYMEA